MTRSMVSMWKARRYETTLEEPPASMSRVLVPDRINAASPWPTSRKRISSCWAEIGRAVTATARARHSNATRFMVHESYALLRPSGRVSFGAGFSPRGFKGTCRSGRRSRAFSASAEVEEPAVRGPLEGCGCRRIRRAALERDGYEPQILNVSGCATTDAASCGETLQV